MTRFTTVVVGAAVGLGIGVGTAMAGPCTDQVDRLAMALSDPSGKAMGTLSGAAPGGAATDAPMPNMGEKTEASAGKSTGTLAGATPDARQGAAEPAPQVAKSAQDVRLQQQGMPTMAQGGDPAEADARLEQAKASLEKARSLDQQNDEGCMAAVQEAEQAMRAEQ